MDAALIVGHLIDRDRTAGALVGVNADMRVLIIGFYRNKSHRFAACGYLGQSKASGSVSASATSKILSIAKAIHGSRDRHVNSPDEVR